MSVINANWTQALPQRDIAFADLPKTYLCSYCYLSLLQAIQSTPYSNYDESFVGPYQDAQKGEIGGRILAHFADVGQSAVSISQQIHTLGHSM